MPLAESRASILICTVDQFTHFIPFLETEWNSFPNLSHFLDINLYFPDLQISLWITENIVPAHGTSIQLASVLNLFPA